MCVSETGTSALIGSLLRSPKRSAQGTSVTSISSLDATLESLFCRPRPASIAAKLGVLSRQHSGAPRNSRTSAESFEPQLKLGIDRPTMARPLV